MTVLNSGLPLSPSALRKLSRFRPAIFAISPVPRARNQPKGVAHEIRIRGFERRRDVCDLTFFRVEIVGGVKSGRLASQRLRQQLGAFDVPSLRALIASLDRPIGGAVRPRQLARQP
jgi:hypothetical protein